MYPIDIFSYYPSYSLLDEYSLDSDLVLYVDIRNCMGNLYSNHVVSYMIETSNKYGKIDTSIISSLFSFISFHKLYARKRGIDLKIVFFYEVGRSYYHESICKEYKGSIKITTLHWLTEADRNLFFDSIRRNLGFAVKIFNGFPSVYFVCLKDFEADFVPYYVIENKILSEEHKDVTNIIYSNDKDMLQITEFPNSVIYRKCKRSMNRIVNQNSTLSEYFGFDIGDYPVWYVKYLPIFMSIIGDKGDDISGIHGIGKKRCKDMIEDLVDLCGDMKEVYDKVENGLNIFGKEYLGENKYIKGVIEEESKTGIISRNLRLISYDLISRYFNKCNSTEKLTAYNEFMNTFHKKKDFDNPSSILNTIKKLDIYLEDDDIFWNAWGV